MYVKEKKFNKEHFKKNLCVKDQNHLSSFATYLIFYISQLKKIVDIHFYLNFWDEDFIIYIWIIVFIFVAIITMFQLL